jgi:hypothetical protein
MNYTDRRQQRQGECLEDEAEDEVPDAIVARQLTEDAVFHQKLGTHICLVNGRTGIPRRLKPVRYRHSEMLS